MMTSSTCRHSSSDIAIGATLRRVDGPTVRVRCSVRADGDFHPGRSTVAELRRRQRALIDLPWTMTVQSHGIDVVDVESPGAGDGSSGDVLTTASVGAVLGCWAADCAVVVALGTHDRIAVAHAGWRGIEAGVLDVLLRACGTPVETIVLGPVIGPCCYEFGASDLDRMAARLGVPVGTIRGRTSWGSDSLDVPALIAGFADRHGLSLERLGGCTGCEYPGFSYRVRQDRARHVVAVWQDAA